MRQQKIKLSDEFKYCTDEFRAETNAWLAEMFGYEDDNTQEVVESVVRHDDVNLQPARKRKSPRTVLYEHDGIKYNTISELLEHLDYTFKFLVYPDSSNGFLEKDVMRGLRNLGVHVPCPWLFNMDAKIGDHPLPALMSVGLPHDVNADRKKELYSPHIFYAVKRKQLPPHVELLRGVPYFFGEAYEFHGRVNWFGSWIVVQRGGIVKFCRQRSAEYKELRHKRGGRDWYLSRGYDYSPFIKDHAFDNNITPEESIELHARIFKNLVTWWSGRDSRWNVSVTNGKHRVTFGVDGNETRYFFADRDKTAIASDGRLKRIIHYVRGHDRIVNGKSIWVDPHIRGIREFDWNTYHCRITAPKFHNPTAAAFTIPPVDFDGDTVPDGYVDASLLGRMLANFEDGIDIGDTQ